MFDLFVSKFAKEKFDLRRDWGGFSQYPDRTEGRYGRILGGALPDRHVLGHLSFAGFLRTCALYLSYRRAWQSRYSIDGPYIPADVSCTEADQSRMSLRQYQEAADEVEAGYVEAARLLEEAKVLRSWYLPGDGAAADTVAGAFAMARLRDEEFDREEARKRLRRWFWALALGKERKHPSDSRRIVNEACELASWLTRRRAYPPYSVMHASLSKERIAELRDLNSNLYHGLFALVILHGGRRDLITGKPMEDMIRDDDEIEAFTFFPFSWCDLNGVSRPRRFCVLNMTRMAKETEWAPGISPPSEYLPRLEKEHGISPEEMDDRLRSHGADPAHMRNDDFNAFYEARMNLILKLAHQEFQRPWPNE